MSKARAALVAVMIVAPLILAFNNCGKAEFGQAGAETAGLSLSIEEQDEIANSLPPEVLEDEPRPVADLENDPNLYELYKCPNSDGVVICHFPENVQAYSTRCVGRAAVKSHYDHIRTYGGENATKVIGDYLGPCRISL